ncbi:MAG TPA: alkylhydroperoxidase domain protein [Cellulomonas sp.]|nr:alkylhydroperoxidase domain protein [Cellulomonas sp.]
MTDDTLGLAVQDAPADAVGRDTDLDTIDRVLGDAASSVAAARAFRPAVVAHAQANVAALFGPVRTSPGLAGRLAVAHRVALLVGEETLAGHYASALAALGDDRWLDARVDALLTHAQRLSTSPALAAPADLDSLRAAGWTTAEIVTISQVVGFTQFQARTIAGLRLLAASRAPVDERPDASDGRTRDLPATPVTPPEPARRDQRPFTQDHLDWTAWLAPLDLSEADDEQRAVLTGFRGEMPYFRLLALDARALAARTALDNAIFFGHGGLPRAERELAATVTSRVNGCVFCASVHSARASELSGRREDVQRLLDEGIGTTLDTRWRAIVDLAAALSTTPVTAEVAHVRRAQAAGLRDEEILDVVHAAAFFAWANRLMLSLGEPVEVAAQP